MNAESFLTAIIEPCAAQFPFRDTHEARVLLLAIAGQESSWSSRAQARGPARGFWQFEQGTIQLLMTNPTTSNTLFNLCVKLEITWSASVIYEAIKWNDVLAYACARLLLWAEKAPLPIIGASKEAWSYYLHTWHPGHPRPIDWPDNYEAAEQALT
jgi:hypothetical protein